MKVVILWLINEHGEILMARRAAHMSTDAGVWGPSVSGRIESEESPLEAALREAQEELGILANEISPVFLHDEAYDDHSDGKKREFSIYYATVPMAIVNRFKLEPNEVSETKWFKRGELKSLVDRESEEIIISSATGLWRNIFANLQAVTA